MDKNNIEDIAKAICALDAWDKVFKYNWALVSELLDNPLIVCAHIPANGPVKARLMFFNGFAAHRDFAIFMQNPDVSFALSPIDIDHLEVLALKDGGVEVLDCRPGYAPVRPNEEMRAVLSPILCECYGLIMRIEDDPEIPAMYKDRNAMFSRKEGLDGKWRDAPLKVPDISTITWTEHIALDRSKCSQAARFNMAKGEAWEVDFIQLPIFRTDDKDPRVMYLFAAVDANTGERRVWDKIAVDPKFPRNGSLDGLKVLWESLASRILEGVLKRGEVPSEIHIRTQRLMRFLRPLGLQIPVKLVLHQQLPRLTAEVNNSILSRNI
ncbi:MAG: hypothetical protein J6R18_06255 [Kiritimatiellae bacterium]|nr:hypothetical protein [Kiritimatiellia bacterium]